MKIFFTCVFLVISHLIAAQSEDWLSDVTEISGLKGVLAAKVYAGDLNNDQFPDLVVISGVDYFTNRQSLSIYMNEPGSAGRNFVNRTSESGINSNRDVSQDGRRTTALAMADIDNDGDLDIVTGVYFHRKETTPDNGDRAEVLLNDGKGKFTILKDNGISQLERLNTQGLSFLDADKDGIIDLFLGNWSEDHTNNIFQRDVLLLGKGDGSFKDFSFESQLNSQPAEPLYGSSCGDWNNDGWPDIFTAPYCRTKGSLWKNNGNLTFKNVADEAGYNAQFMNGDNGQALCMWAAYPADYDNDGDFDFFFTLVHGGLDANEGHSTLVENLGPDSSYKLVWRLSTLKREFPRPNHQADYEASWFDIDNDGLLDLTVGQGSYDGNPGRIYVFRQNADHSFEDISIKLNLVRYPFRPSNRVRTLDYDLDGDEDLFISGGTSNELFLMRNEVGNRNNFVAFDVKGHDGVNLNAIGTNIKLYTKNGTLMKEIYAGQGNAAGQGPFIQYFGLGQQTEIDSAIFVLPNKLSTQWKIEKPGVNSIHSIDKTSFETVGGLANKLVTVYPNPAETTTQIQIKNGAWENGYTLKIYNHLGQLVYLSESLKSNQQLLNLSGISSGIYYLNFIPTQGKTEVHKILIR